MIKEIKNISKSLLILSATWTLAACNTPITDFVSDAEKIPGEIAGGSLASGPTALKVSPGQLKASGANSAAVANVTATNQLLSSPNASGVFSISRSRASQ